MGGLLTLLLPGYILELSQDEMFPVSWHVLWNRAWLLQTLLSFVWLMWTKRWLCAWGIKKGWVFWQFRVMLITHGVFYGVEISATSIYQKFTAMFVHHIFSFVIFACFLYEANALSVVSVIPVLLHQIYWVWNPTSIFLLFIYNFFLMACGSIGLFQISAIDAIHRPISYVMPVSAISISGVNYFAYCHHYPNPYCLPLISNDPLPRAFQEISTSALICLAVIFIIYFCAASVRKRWAEVGYVPPFAIKPHKYVEVEQHQDMNAYKGPKRRDSEEAMGFTKVVGRG